MLNVKRLAGLFSAALLVVMLLVSGCELSTGSTGQTSNDAQAVQQFFPAPAGYTITQVNDITAALQTVTGGAALASGNVPAAIAIERLTTLINCYREVGAVDARVYSQINFQTTPTIGAVAIVNQDRAADNFLSCLTQSPGIVGPQSATKPQPCISSGSFTSGGDTFLYIYAASDQSVCTAFQQHFDTYRR